MLSVTCLSVKCLHAPAFPECDVVVVVVQGQDVVDRLQNVGVDRGARPFDKVVVEDCGLVA